MKLLAVNITSSLPSSLHRLDFRMCGYFCIALGILVCPWWTFNAEARLECSADVPIF